MLAAFLVTFMDLQQKNELPSVYHHSREELVHYTVRMLSVHSFDNEVEDVTTHDT
jgi:hypothetical protein